MPGLFIERHARAVAAHARVAVLYIHPDENLTASAFETDLTRDDELFQVRIYYRPSKIEEPLLKSLFNIILYLKYHRIGMRIIRRDFGRPDLVHVNVLTRLGMIALLYKWISGTPYVITEHWTRYLPYMDNFRGWMRKRITRLVVKKASAVLPVTFNLQKAMEKHGLKNRNYRIIPNVVDMNMFEIQNASTDRFKKHFIHVSCFEDKQKNISGILRVLKKLSEIRQDWDCVMIGEGIHLDRLINYARELEIEDSFVRFSGLKENRELATMMAEADFQVMFSRFENLPVVILESYACGVPVLSTDVGGIKEHLNAKLGILIKSENENELLEKIIFMLDHYQEFDKSGIRKYAEENFSREVIGKQLAHVYRDVIDKNNRIQA
jgi:glycosyltransferase involved in cell wall biosynthesis